ncbi:uncharacterized protein EDB91DRAFT_309586 [Suillus paluster]|uniref:uncharacterized protein n=1 Tax=Suillus paluster TaxID=48578 RepID=UPI001B877A9D|nr:uncharacterized protein EDB91DRAFT_309586 [Suillus paluster]KAG1742384.1 hypothetical protein EDB91DRAFT_309586 [Suillus paluster]
MPLFCTVSLWLSRYSRIDGMCLLLSYYGVDLKTQWPRMPFRSKMHRNGPRGMTDGQALPSFCRDKISSYKQNNSPSTVGRHMDRPIALATMLLLSVWKDRTPRSIDTWKFELLCSGATCT